MSYIIYTNYISYIQTKFVIQILNKKEETERDRQRETEIKGERQGERKTETLRQIQRQTERQKGAISSI